MAMRTRNGPISAPLFGKQSPLGIEGSGNRIWSGGKAACTASPTVLK